MNDTEQVIDVPKISCPTRPPRAVLAATLMVEQLVEVLVLSSRSESQQHFVEQNVDIPVHGGVQRARGDLQGNIPGQSSLAISRGGLQCSVPGQSSTASSREGLQGHVLGQGSSALRAAVPAVVRRSLVPGQG